MIHGVPSTKRSPTVKKRWPGLRAKEALARTKGFIKSCDEVYGFVEKNYKRGDATDFVKMVDMYADFQNKVMVDFTKEEKRALTKKKYVSDIKTNLYLRRFYKRRLMVSNIAPFCMNGGRRRLTMGLRRTSNEIRVFG